MDIKAKEAVALAKDKMHKAVDYLENELQAVRAGKANPAMLNNISVDYYGTMTPLAQVSSVTSPDARTIVIQPWEKAMIGPIEKAILTANIGFNPQNNGEVVRINVPPLTEDRRKDLVKQCKQEGETAKVSIRNARRDTIEAIKKMQKDGLSEDLAKDFEADVQKVTDEFNKKVDGILEKKEKEIMTV